jgi:hypothetical protein
MKNEPTVSTTNNFIWIVYRTDKDLEAQPNLEILPANEMPVGSGPECESV